MSVRTLTPGLISALGKTVTRPGWLIYLGTDTPIRMSSMGTVDWNGNNWVDTDIVVSQIVSTPNGTQNSNVQIGNTDYSFGIFALSGALKGVPITVYMAYADALGSADVVSVFDGYVQAPKIGDRWVTMSVSTDINGPAVFPNERIGAQIGINKIRPAGSKITWNGQAYVLERRK